MQEYDSKEVHYESNLYYLHFSEMHWRYLAMPSSWSSAYYYPPYMYIMYSYDMLHCHVYYLIDITW